jgi:predicted RNA methylase
VEITSDILFEDIKQGPQSVDKLVLVFKPPFGSVIEVSDVPAVTEAHDAPTSSQNPVQLFLNQDGNTAQDQRVVQFDAFSGAVTRVANTTLPATP